MAVTEQTLTELMRQRAAIDAIVDAGTRDLIVAWARAWDEMAAELHEAIEQVLAGNATVSARIAAIRARRAQLVAVEALNRLARQAGVSITADALRLINAAPPDALRLVALQFPLDEHARLGVD